MIVHKFGGTSVGDAQRIGSVADIIASNQRQGSIAVVVSAIKGTTDRLIAGARAAAAGAPRAGQETRAWLESSHFDIASHLLGESEEGQRLREQLGPRLDALVRLLDSIAVLGELTARGQDAVVCYGEQLSAALLAAVLRHRGTRAEAIAATELIVTDQAFGAAIPEMALTRKRITDRVRPMAEAGIVPVITGYIGATEDGVPTTLGRSGSDFSAAIVAACLDADELQIWTDVDGILTADPNVVPAARVLRELSYSEAARLARFGAEVLHPRTVGPVIENSIPLRIVNSFDPSNAGTRIVETPSEGRTLRPAIISATGLRLLRLRSAHGDWRLASAIDRLAALSHAGIDVLMFSQSFSELGINLIVRQVDAAHAATLLQHVNGSTLGVEDDPADVAAISVIGFSQTLKPAIASRAFSILGGYGVPVLAVAQAAAEDSVSFCIPGDRAEDTVRFLHASLNLEGAPT